MRDEQDKQPDNEDQEPEPNIQDSMASLQRLSSLETETQSAEIHLLGQLRDRLSPAARYAGNIHIKYRKVSNLTGAESEQMEYLLEGFPFVERGKPLTGLLVIDRYSTVELEPGKDGMAGSGQYAGERLYLTPDRKWILAERVGAYSGARGSTSEWEATCRIVTDRSLLEHYSMEVITDGLFEATNKLWEKLSPRLDALKKRSDKAQEISGKLTQLRSGPLRAPTEPKPSPKPDGEPTAAAAAVAKILFGRN